MNGDEEKYSPFTPTLSKAPFTRSRKPAAGVVSSRYEEYSGGCGTMVSVRMSLHRAALLSRACRSLSRRRPASVPRRLRPKLFTTHFLAKRSPGPAAGGGAPVGASRPRAQGLPYQKEPAGHACHNCHSERSGSTNAASAETACGLCRARRRKTNEVQSRIYEGQSGIRFFVDLPISSE